MIRAKELERVLPKGALRREPGRKGRYQLVIRQLDAAQVLSLVDPLWEVFGVHRPTNVHVDHDGRRYSCTVAGRRAVLFVDEDHLADGWWSQLDGQLDLVWPDGTMPPPKKIVDQLTQLCRFALDWRPPPALS